MNQSMRRCVTRVVLAGLAGLLVVAIPQPGFAQAIHFKQVDQATIEARLKSVKQKNDQREAALKAMFTEAGCPAAQLEEQAIPRESLPNVVCTLPGTGDSVIIVGAHYDIGEKGDGVVDDWTGTALLPTLLQSLSSEPRKHTFVFVGFGAKEQHLAGSQYYAKQMSKSRASKVHAMIELDALGLGPTNIWLNAGDHNLANILNAVAKAMKQNLGLINADALGRTDFTSFKKRHIPILFVHSITKDTFPIIHSDRDRLDAVNMAAYYQNYRLLAAYLAFLDLKID